MSERLVRAIIVNGITIHSYTDEEMLRMERVAREDVGSPEADRWQRAEAAFTFWRERTSLDVPPDWESLPGLERVIWYDRDTPA